MTQLHKQFSTDQVRILLTTYEQGHLRRKIICRWVICIERSVCGRAIGLTNNVEESAVSGLTEYTLTAPVEVCSF
jgi:hypothetical protein